MGGVQKTFVMNSGERYCLLVDSCGLPLYFPSLYVTTQVRNRSLSLSAMESTLSGISVLNSYFLDNGKNIEKMFSERQLLNDFELDGIRDYCQKNFRSQKENRGFKEGVSLKQLKSLGETVSSETEYVRLTVISKYLKWLTGQLINLSNDGALVAQIQRMEEGLKSRRPVKKNRNSEADVEALSEDQLDLLFEIFRPESDLNPFSDKSVRVRNRLIFVLLYHLGLRGGELLNIRIRDIDFGSNQLIIARRADEKDDPRKDQPLVKTLDRRLPLRDTLANEIHHYILYDRKAVANASKNDFLLVTHKSGPTQGQPLSKSAYKKVIGVIRQASPLLFDLTGHKLRHSWNELFSTQMDLMDEPPSVEQQEKIRSYLMGWREGSGTASVYNKRFIRRKAQEAGLKLQAKLTKLPKRLKGE